jgi:phenylacetic acid degradation operon negative regulatory protein
MGDQQDRPAALAPFVDDLHAQGRLRVWSILVTLFGDLAGPLPGQLALRDIHMLTRQFGITDGAVRTALSRLLAEEWLVSGKSGRHAFYALSPSGIEAVAEASPRIYAPPQDEPESWQLIVANPAALPVLSAAQAVRLTSECWLLPAAQTPPADALVLTGQLTKRPGWLADRLVSTRLTDEYAKLAGLTHRLQGQLTKDGPAALAPETAMALRVLLLHFWRRLVLRHSPHLFWLLGPDWPGAQAARLIGPLWHQLLELSESWPMPDSQRAPISLLKNRFGNNQTG